MIKGDTTENEVFYRQRLGLVNGQRIRRNQSQSKILSSPHGFITTSDANNIGSHHENGRPLPALASVYLRVRRGSNKQKWITDAAQSAILECANGNCSMMGSPRMLRFSCRT